MKRTYAQLIFIQILLIIIIALPLLAQGIETEASLSGTSSIETQIVEVELARFVAEDYLQKFYKDEWMFFEKFIGYDIDGIPSMYFFVFRKADSKITTYDDLDLRLRTLSEEKIDYLNRINSIQDSTDISEDLKDNELRKLSKYINSIKRNLYHPDSFATVVTGATEGSPLHVRHYRGLPSFLVMKDGIQTELGTRFPEMNLKTGRLICITPRVIYFELNERVSQSTISAKNLVGKASRQQFSDDTYAIKVKKGEKAFERISSIRAKLSEKKAEKRKILLRMSSRSKELIAEEENKTKKYYKSKWLEYRNKYLGASQTNNIDGGEDHE